MENQMENQIVNAARRMRPRVPKNNCTLPCCMPNRIDLAKQDVRVAKRKVNIGTKSIEQTTSKQPSSKKLKIAETNAPANTSSDHSKYTSREMEAALALLDFSRQPIQFGNDVDTIKFKREYKINRISENSVKTKKVTYKVVDTLIEDKSEDYSKFLKKELDAIRAANGGELFKTNENMRRNVLRSNAPDPKDVEKMNKYLAARLKNNLSAKKSRNKRTVLEITNTIREKFLCIQNQKLQNKLISARIVHKKLSLIVDKIMKSEI